MTTPEDQKIASIEDKKLHDQRLKDPEGFAKEVIMFLKSLNVLIVGEDNKDAVDLNPEIVDTWHELMESNVRLDIEQREGYCLHEATIQFLSTHSSLEVYDVAFMARMAYTMAFIHATIIDTQKKKFTITEYELKKYSDKLEESKNDKFEDLQ